ncbi:MAG: selenocysteine-specific translation elongation factor, partial [Anaerolineales bacterium]|nr:selenocysteine-specific translation elongation factor [Anaerolineales bacterium]
MFVIGTAGHVDHGKSTLVEALTGINPDRLREEQEREMTIDLGFAWVDLPGGETIGIVDVPGHRDFIENMLAGVGGIDAALFVIAADEGVMPQTREHLAILDLLEVNGGVIALTKTDLVDDAEWLELVTLDVAETLEDTVLADASIIPVSARTGRGLERLKQALADCLSGRPPRPDKGRPRLPVDRVFTLSGFGTVVTGTLTDGVLESGQTIEVQPGGRTSRIRGLQTHKEKIDRAAPGSRVAINLTGIRKSDLERGQVVTTPGWLRPTVLTDVRYRHLPRSDRPLRHNEEVKLFSGSAETLARTRVLGQEEIQPGASGWVQLRLAEPVALVTGDRFILRRPSPGQTLGGGTIVDPAPRRRHRRFRPDVVARLETLAQGTPAEILVQTLETRGPLTRTEAVSHSRLDSAEVALLVPGLIETGRVVAIGSKGPAQLLLARTMWTKLLDKATALLATYHQDHPLRQGMMREELKSRLRLSAKEFNGFMELAAQQGCLQDEGVLVRLPDHEIRFTLEQQAAVEQLIHRFHADPFGTPSYKECVRAVGDDVLGVLAGRGELVQISPDVLFLA